MKILLNLLCQYNNIYKKKVKAEDQKKKKTLTTVAIVPPGTVATVQN